jgi:hypothetical protein
MRINEGVGTCRTGARRLPRARIIIAAIFVLLGAEPLAAQAQDAPRPGGQTMPARVTDIPVPSGCTRVPCDSASFGGWLRRLPLLRRTAVLDYRGDTVRRASFRVRAVLDLPLLFTQDLEQCADYAMRLWAEWHRAAGRLAALALFANSGRRVRLAASGRDYHSFLKWAFMYANSASLKRGCSAIAAGQLQPGDLIVQNERGGIGHVSVIMDACAARDGTRYYLIGFSFMPAQEFHIEQARDGQGAAGWFRLDGFYRYLEECLDVGQPVLRRF